MKKGMLREFFFHKLHEAGEKLPPYVAIMLDEHSRSSLLTAVPPIHPTVFATHCTVFFKPDAATLSSLPIGEKVQLHVTKVVEDEKGQAVVVEHHVEPRNRNPHITISCAAGVKPVYSNEILGLPGKTMSLALSGIVSSGK